MRLRALHLDNVRRFAGQRLSVTGIGDGITVIAEPNEFGKSTLFDALHALMFAKYSGRPEPVRALQPYAGGAVTVRAEVETDAGRFAVEKRFLSRPMARVTRLPDRAVLAQEDAAEAWIADALGAQGKGPAGMLWVRQGQLGLEPEKPAERAELTEARRDILSSVAGEIDAMTGGRRMDRVRRQVGAALAELTTATGRPTAAWKEAREQVTALEGELAEAEARVADLADKLAERARLEAQARRLDDPEADTRRRVARREARAALEAAQAHAGKLRAVELARDLAAREAEKAKGDLDRFLAAINTLETARKAAAESATAAQDAAGDVATAKTALDTAQARSDTAEAALQTAHRALTTTRAQVEARKARDRAAELSQRLKQVEAAQKAQETAAAQVQRLLATPDRLAQIEALEADLAAAEAAARAQTATLRLDYDDSARPVLRDGTPLPGGTDLPLDGKQRLTLPGIGTLHLTAPAPGAEAAAALGAARDARDKALAEAGAESLTQARDLATQRAEALRARDNARALLDTLAPEGIAPLRTALAEAELAAAEADDSPLPALDMLEKATDTAQAEAQGRADALTRARNAHAHAREAASAAAACADADQRALQTARAATGPEEQHATRRADLLRVKAEADEAMTKAQTTLDALAAEAPDMETLEAEVARTEAAVQTAENEKQATARRVAELNAAITTRAGEGIEETRDRLAEALEIARATDARLTRRAAALTRLRDALDAARAAAQERYFGPVQAELAPLLAILHQDAALSFDSDRLLPDGLTRAGTAEEFDALSGGTREQIAVLTRLAFARLFARQGQHLPIVLDDALVFSDDDRIMRMFTALTRVARDQQIIVLTCRQLAFQDLGGTRPEITLTPL